VSQEELTAYLIRRAAQSGVDPNQLVQQYVQTGTLPAVLAEVARGKALALVVEKATIVDASGRPVQLEQLRQDGTVSDGTPGPGGPDIAFADFDEDLEFADLDDDLEADDEADDHS
jgi:trigger factor